MDHRALPGLQHQIGLFAAPCLGLIDPFAYAELVERAARILSGETKELEHELNARMKSAAAELEYERAAQWRDRLAALRRTVEGQGVTPKDKIARDVLALARHANVAVVHRLAFRDGRLSESRSHVFQSELPDSQEFPRPHASLPWPSSSALLALSRLRHPTPSVPRLRVSPVEFAHNLRRMVAAARQQGSRVILVSTVYSIPEPPLGEEDPAGKASYEAGGWEEAERLFTASVASRPAQN